MDLIAWALYAFIAAGVLLGTLLYYQRKEPPGRGRVLLAALRGGALALLVLLLFDPAVPAGRDAAQGLTVALVDASLSMRLPAPDGTTRWSEARRAVAELAPDRVVVFGAGEAVQVRSLNEIDPGAPGSRLAPALRAALESGAGRLVVVTDGALEDVDEVARLARERGIAVEIARVGEQTAGNLGLAELEVPGWALAGEEVVVSVGVSRLGDAVPDSVAVSVTWGGAELSRVHIATPPEGRVSAAVLRFTPPAGMEGLVRVDAALDVVDAEPADDRRSAYLTVAERPAGVALVSFHADQEPRFLLPVLERAVGLPTRGWIAVGGDRFVRVGLGREAGTVATATEVRGALADADLVVLHGLDDTAPAWASAAVRGPRVLLFPRGPISGVPVSMGGAAAGEWYASAQPPASPMAPFLAAVQPEAAPPLTALRPADPPPGWWSPLDARRDRRGEPRPVLLAGEANERRMVVALADGYWRWAFGDTRSRALYDALWSGVSGWLMEAAPARVAEGVRPAARVVPRGEPLRWVVPLGIDSVRISLRPDGGDEPAGPADGPGTGEPAALDTVLAALDGVAVQSPPPPGHYRYDARSHGTGGEAAVGSGEVTVERYSPEFTRPSRPLVSVGGADAAAPARAAARPSRPLRSWGWPYLVLVTLLCAEWVLRRRWGLR
jgi:hypothetical protein